MLGKISLQILQGEAELNLFNLDEFLNNQKNMKKGILIKAIDENTKVICKYILGEVVVKVIKGKKFYKIGKPAADNNYQRNRGKYLKDNQKFHEKLLKILEQYQVLAFEIVNSESEYSVDEKFYNHFLQQLDSMDLDFEEIN